MKGEVLEDSGALKRLQKNLPGRARLQPCHNLVQCHAALEAAEVRLFPPHIEDNSRKRTSGAKSPAYFHPLRNGWSLALPERIFHTLFNPGSKGNANHDGC
jgi:hypothetical protein